MSEKYYHNEILYSQMNDTLKVNFKRALNNAEQWWYSKGKTELTVLSDKPSFDQRKELK